MNDEKKMNFWRRSLSILTIVLLGINAILGIATFEALRQCILYICALMLATISLVLDGIMKNGKRLCLDSIYYIVLSYTLITNLFNI